MKLWVNRFFLGSLVVVVVSNILACNPPPPSSPSLKVRADIKPKWDDSGSETPAPDSITHEFHLLWDQSIPMGGYIHRIDPDSQATLKLIHEILKNARLTTDFGGGESSLKCLGIADSIVSVDCNRSMAHDFFSGSNSRLDQGIEYILGGLRNGTFKGAALVSDLIATTVYGTGAVALLPYLNNPSMKAYYNSGEIDIALLGIHIDYWGVHRGPCRTTPDSVGCWFNESQKRYQPLEKVERMPLYILIIGRRSEGKTREDNSVHKMATEFFKQITSQGIEIKHETVTQGPLGNQTEFEWDRYATTGYEKVGLTDRGYYCKDNETHSLVGRFTDSLLSVIEIEMHDSLETVAASTDVENAQQVNFELNCKALRQKLLEDQSGLCNDPPYQLEGIVEYQGQGDWVGWSSVSPRSNRTPGLEQFLNGIRPSRYEVIIKPAPPLEICKGDQ